LAYDFDEHYSEIDVPLLAFQSQFFGYKNYGEFQRGIANPDVTVKVLWGYGHLDVYSGEYSMNDVSAPVYEWMVSHRMLIGFSWLKINCKWICGEAAIYINATTIDFKVNGVRISWAITSKFIIKTVEVYNGKDALGFIIVFIFKDYNFVFVTGTNMLFLGELV
jgi:hypothetical protein